ncbi:cation:proton antiporter, partial [Candidatus Woesearchaeota archaeon]|nr:cation:proton antiporter [Candidatus Woesearchaeota archaeon]
MTSLLIDIGIVIIVATLLAYFARYLKQPLILAYIIAGIVIGPIGFRLISDHANIIILSELGIAFMLFIVGLELDIKRLAHLGFVTVTAGIGQIIFTFIVGYLIALCFFSKGIAIFIAIALTFSSTIIIIKLYSDKNELGTLHGRIVLGILIAQDLVAVFIIAVLTGTNGFTLNTISFSLLKGVALIAIAFIAGFLFKYIFRSIARSQELLFLSSVSWCFAMIYIADMFHFSIAIGAFLAGISLASLPYNIEIIGRTSSLRDFFAVMFFVSLGMQITFNGIGNLLIPAIVLSAFVIIGNPLIVLIITGLLRYKARTSFLSAIAIAQISEFSLILVTVGYAKGIVSQEILSLIAIIAVVTFTTSTYMITYDNKLYKIFKRFARFFERDVTKKLEYIPVKKYHAILFGCDRMGQSILKTLKQLKKNVLVVDFDPEVVKEHMITKQPCIYGDIGDLEVLKSLRFDKASLVISTIPDYEDNKLILQKAKEANPEIVVFVTAGHAEEALEL